MNYEIVLMRPQIAVLQKPFFKVTLTWMQGNKKAGIPGLVRIVFLRISFAEIRCKTRAAA